MSIEIDIPAAGQNALVRVNGSTKTICAEGLASRPGSIFPSAIYAKVYLQDPGNVPTPPAGVTQGTLFANNSWQFRGTQEIPGVNCASQSPYTQNWLVVWALYTDLMSPYDTATTTFNGECSTKTDCDN